MVKWHLDVDEGSRCQLQFSIAAIGGGHMTNCYFAQCPFVYGAVEAIQKLDNPESNIIGLDSVASKHIEEWY